MPAKIICPYCNAPYELTKLQCPHCGAPAPAAMLLDSRSDSHLQLKATPAEIAERVQGICEDYGKVDRLYTRETAPAKKIRHLCRALEIADPAEIIGLYDSTVFGSGRTGFAICIDGLHWKNPWPNYPPSKHWFLPWPQFVQRTIDVGEKESYIDLGYGDQIGVLMKKNAPPLIAMFKEIQLTLLTMMTEEDALGKK